MAPGKSMAAAHLEQEMQMTSTEFKSYKAASHLGKMNPFAKNANPKEDIVWLLDNTAYRPILDDSQDPRPWQAEYVACFYRAGRKEIGSFVSSIADQIGLDGSKGADAESRERIAERIQPFINAVAPARYINIDIPRTGSPPRVRKLGPSKASGVSSQNFLTGGGSQSDGTTIVNKSHDNLFPNLSANTRFAGPEGWAIISDIDDTIKITQTSDPIGILKSTFAEVPETTEGMPEFYKVLDEQFKEPAWFYLSASPFNLYPFLHTFIYDNYKPGTIILRDKSWMHIGGLLQSLTQGVEAYKTSRMEKIHRWLPRRKFICIGDSTQSDPETYGKMYRKYKGWIKAIYIRKVMDIPHMEMKNRDERFQKAFQGVPAYVWRAFTRPNELADHVKHVAGQAHIGIVGASQGHFCHQRHGEKKADAGSSGANRKQMLHLGRDAWTQVPWQRVRGRL